MYIVYTYTYIVIHVHTLHIQMRFEYEFTACTYIVYIHVALASRAIVYTMHVQQFLKLSSVVIIDRKLSRKLTF